MPRAPRTYPPEYWSTIAADWDRVVAHPTNPHQFYYREADLLISRFLSKRMRVLELGCGTGLATKVHAAEVRHLVATDFARGMVRRARRTLSAELGGARHDLLVCDGQDLPFHRRVFDAVFSRGVMLSYVRDPRQVLAEMHRVLRPNGVVAFDVMIRLAGPTEQRPGGVFVLLGREPTYSETRRIAGRQVRRIFFLPRTSPFLAAARSRKVCRKRPEAVRRHAVSVETFEARLFRPAEIEALPEDVGFGRTEITPLGHLAYLLSTDDPGLRRVLRKHDRELPKVSIGLANHLKMETALHLFVAAQR